MPVDVILDVVIAAFQHKTGPDDVYVLPATRFAELAIDSRSTGAAGRVGVVSRKAFIEQGKRIKVVRDS